MLNSSKNLSACLGSDINVTNFLKTAGHSDQWSGTVTLSHVMMLIPKYELFSMSQPFAHPLKDTGDLTTQERLSQV